MKTRYGIISAMIVAAAALRLLPHPANFTPIAALALFAGARFDDKRWAFLIPLAAMALSDLLIGFNDQMPVTYGAFAVIVAMGFLLKGKTTVLRIAWTSAGAATFFFIVSNFGVWATTGLYPLNASGLIACYLAGIPFFQNSLVSTLFYSAVLFGGFGLMERRVSSLARVRAQDNAC
ncbi:MAG TPA: DUF6580 family putative transport protein [Terriglobales bacterium]|nr:DUF6580 family putative transport protein [Terriglobales bacterium]